MLVLSDSSMASDPGAEEMAQAQDSESALCLLLDKMPAELRNNIYELTFSSDHDDQDSDEATHVNLMDAKPPSKSLLLACRQIHQEAKGIYQEAYRNYWRHTNFVCGRKFLEYSVADIKEADLDQITKFRIVWRRPHNPDRNATWFRVWVGTTWCWKTWPAKRRGLAPYRPRYIALRERHDGSGSTEPVWMVCHDNPIKPEVFFGGAKDELLSLRSQLIYLTEQEVA